MLIFLPFRIRDSLVQQWKIWLLSSLICLIIWSTPLYVTNSCSITFHSWMHASLPYFGSPHPIEALTSLSRPPSVWIPFSLCLGSHTRQTTPPCEHSPHPTLSLSWSHCDPPPLGSHHPMCGCQPCCAPPTGFKTELSRKGKGRKGRGGDRRKGKGQKRKRKTFAPADTNWNWWVFLVFLLSQLTYQPFLIWSSLC